jgi:DNA-binding Xre family transcriptional regulator
VAAAGVRALMRATGLSQHTLEAIRAGRRVRSATIQRIVAALRNDN